MTRSALLAAAVLIAGCGSPKTPAPAESKAAPEYFKVDPATAASLQGKVRFEGKRVVAKRISMEAEQACQALHKEPVLDQAVVAGKDGGLANVFVYIKSGLEGKAFPPAKEAVVLDQRGCQFVPRVVALRTGQTFTVKNSDPVSHNIHPMPLNNRDWNQQQPPESPDLQRRFAKPEVMIPVKCNVHAWMKTYIGVLDHPFFTVTDQSGSFKFEGMSPGEYTVAAWHESFGETTQTIKVRESESASSNFVFR